MNKLKDIHGKGYIALSVLFFVVAVLNLIEGDGFMAALAGVMAVGALFDRSQRREINVLREENARLRKQLADAHAAHLN